MKIWEKVSEIVLNFVFVFIVYVVTIYLYNQIVHGRTLIDWNDVIKYTIIFGIILTAVKMFGSKKDKE